MGHPYRIAAKPFSLVTSTLSFFLIQGHVFLIGDVRFLIWTNLKTAISSIILLILVLPLLYSRTHVFSLCLYSGRGSLVSQHGHSASHMLLCNMKANCLTSGNGVSYSSLLHRLLKKCCTPPRIKPHQSKVNTYVTYVCLFACECAPW